MFQALVAVLEANFRDFGEAGSMIRRGDFALSDTATGQEIDLQKKWDVLFRPGQAIMMSLIFKREGASQDTSCPSCHSDCPSEATKETQWCVLLSGVLTKA